MEKYKKKKNDAPDYYSFENRIEFYDDVPPDTYKFEYYYICCMRHINETLSQYSSVHLTITPVWRERCLGWRGRLCSIGMRMLFKVWLPKKYFRVDDSFNAKNETDCMQLQAMWRRATTDEL